MARPRVTIDATMFAAAVRVDRAVEADIRRVVASDDRACRVDAQRRGQWRRLFVGRTPTIVERHALFGFEAPAVVARGTPSLALSEGDRHIHVQDGASATGTLQEQISDLSCHSDIERGRDVAADTRRAAQLGVD